MKIIRNIALAMFIAIALLLCACGDSKAPAQSPEPTPVPTPAPDLNEGIGSIRISEVMAKNRSTLRDEDGDFSDWIELENCAQEAVELSGWSIGDSENRSWALPAVSLDSGERIIVFASGKDRTNGILHADFALSAGESLYLRNKWGTVGDSLNIAEAEADVSLVRGEDGFAECLYPTPAYENSAAGFDARQAELACDSPLIINEVAVSSLSYYAAANIGDCDWVELKNVSSEPLLLSDYYLSDDDDNLALYRLPELTLKPGALMLFACDEDSSVAKSHYTTGFSLNSTNEQLYLTRQDGVIADYISLKDIPYECSYGRVSGENGFFYFESPSPSAENKEGERRVAASPVSLEADGVFEGVDKVTASLEAAGTIYYTTDGSYPTEASNVYSGPIELTETSIVRAVAVEDGALPSRALTLSYFINEGHTLPVASLVADSYQDFRNIYANGRKGIELPGSISLYEDDSSFTIPCGMKMNGETSLVLAKRNVALRFRGAYGEETLNYDLYDDGGVTEFTHLVLRAGQDYYAAVVRNEFCQNLCLQMTDKVITQRSKYCVLYINGNYYGVYAMKEKTNEQLYASVAGVSKESVSMVEATVRASSSFYSDVYQFVTQNNMSKPENFQKLCSVLDMESFIDWIILEGWAANPDLQSGNLRYCSSTENGGQWKLVYYDLDAALRHQNNNFYNLFSLGNIAPKQVTLIIRPLMKNEEFREMFLTRFAEVITTTLSNENAVAELDRLVEQIKPEMERDFATHGMSMASWERDVRYVRSFILDNDWQQFNIETICDIFNLSSEEIEKYFG